METRTGAAAPDEKIRGVRWECVRTEERCRDKYRAGGGGGRGGNQGGGEDLCWYSASSALTHHHSPGKHMGGFLYSHKTRSGLVWFWSMFLFFLFSVRICQDCNRPGARQGTEVGQIYAASTHTRAHTHSNLTGCPPHFPATTHSLLFESLAHTNHSWAVWGCLSWVHCRGDAVY